MQINERGNTSVLTSTLHAYHQPGDVRVSDKYTDLISDLGNKKEQPTKTFVQALRGSLLAKLVSLILQGWRGNMIVEINKKDYEIECKECEYDVIGRIVLQKGDTP